MPAGKIARSALVCAGLALFAAVRVRGRRAARAVGQREAGSAHPRQVHLVRLRDRRYLRVEGVLRRGVRLGFPFDRIRHRPLHADREPRPQHRRAAFPSRRPGLGARQPLDLAVVGGRPRGRGALRRDARRQGHRRADGVRRPRHPCALPRRRRRRSSACSSPTRATRPTAPPWPASSSGSTFSRATRRRRRSSIAASSDTTSPSGRRRRRARASCSRPAAPRGRSSLRCPRRSRRPDGCRSSRWTTSRRRWAGRPRTAARSCSRPGPTTSAAMSPSSPTRKGGVVGIVNQTEALKKGPAQMKPQRQSRKSRARRFAPRSSSPSRSRPAARAIATTTAAATTSASARCTAPTTARTTAAGTGARFYGGAVVIDLGPDY